jgi:hypothetical protein
VQEYYEKHGDLAQAARIAMKRIEHSYYKVRTDCKATPPAIVVLNVIFLPARHHHREA